MRIPSAACLLAALAVSIAATPAALAQSQSPAAANPASANPAMWRVSDADSEIFLLGTFHILPPGLDWRSDALNAAFEEAETVWFEAEVDTPAARQKTVHILMTEGFNDNDRTLAQILGPDDAATLAKIAGDLGLPMAAIDPMRPWQAFLTLSVQFIVARGFDPASGVETALINEARLKKRNLKFFETVDEQLRLFTTLPANIEKNLLVITLHDWDEQTADFDALFDAWRTGDVEAIDALMNERMRESAPEVYEALVTKRNRAWADEIGEAMAGSGAALVAVGAGHLVGADSVPELLKSKGFSVERYGAGASAEPDKPAAANGDQPADAIGSLLEDMEAASEDNN